MTKTLHILTDQSQKLGEKQFEFKNDVLQGLSKSHKELCSKYFYDTAGSNLFNQITRHHDYYLTNCELEILQTYKNKLSTILSNESFNLIELGPGEGIKTQLLVVTPMSRPSSKKYLGDFS
ncbi:MAG: L-histidine N(alpha)-methyltransferase, partial [Gammaproteobacteria bacterium]